MGNTKEAKGKQKRKSLSAAEDEAMDFQAQEQFKEEIGARPSKRSRKDEVAELDTSKPSAVFKPKQGRDWTISIALPGSFIANTKDFSQKCDLAARIARAAAVFCVDEIIVFDDAPTMLPTQLQNHRTRSKSKAEVLAQVDERAEPWENPDQFLFHLLNYLETPPHLRRRLFPVHPNLREAGKLPSLDMPHHMRQDEWCEYREGVTLDDDEVWGMVPSQNGEKSTWVDCGLRHPVQVPIDLEPNMRVTLKFANPTPPRNWPDLSQQQIASLEVQATSPHTPREESGYYWGFQVRKADSLSSVFQDTTFVGGEVEGYDFTVGTSERGVPLSTIFPDEHTPQDAENKLPARFQHLLLVFGGVAGLEPAVVGDPVLKGAGLTKERAHEVFDLWVDLVPGQGSRTIRTEEAVWLGLMGTRDYVMNMS